MNVGEDTKAGSDGQGNEGGGGSGDNTISLEPEIYNALLDRITELEASTHVRTAPSKGDDVEDDLDSLLEEGKRVTPPSTPPMDAAAIDSMTNSQLAQFIVDVINEQGGKKIKSLEVAVESLRVMDEIDRTSKKFEDFWDFEKAIRKIASANPTLSIEDAYALAKTKGEGASKSDSTPLTRTEKMLRLPPRQPTGEKPGPSMRTTEGIARAVTLRQAANNAWDKVVGKDKTSI